MVGHADDRWQNDWEIFTAYLEQQLQDGASSVELAARFGGREVQWQGIVENVDFDVLAAVVDVALPERIVRFDDGSEVKVDGLTLGVAAESMEQWQAYRKGDGITFRATLGNPRSPFAAIEIKTLNSGKRVIMIRASNALPA